MGAIVKGRWSNVAEPVLANGAFVRAPSAVRCEQPERISSALSAEPGRFHLIGSNSCPWSHRTTIMRALKGLADIIPLHVAGGPRREGYSLAAGAEWTVPGADSRIVHLHQLYSMDDDKYSGRSTVPLLWDSHRLKIVTNESADILRIFDGVAAGPGKLDFTLAPLSARTEIDKANSEIYEGLNNAVYRAGFARSQSAYSNAVDLVFNLMGKLERRLATSRYYFGSFLTETDIRILPTLIRFDAIYYILFKCARRRLIDCPNLWAYARDLYQMKGVRETVHFGAMRRGSYRNDSESTYPIVAVAPDANWEAPHGRAALGSTKLHCRTRGFIEIESSTLKLLH